jgi:hypothetical protein
VIGVVLTILGGLFGTVVLWWQKRKRRQAEATARAATVRADKADDRAAVATVTAEAARDGAAGMVAVTVAGTPREGDPVDPMAAARAQVKRAEDAARAEVAAAKVRRVAAGKVRR